MRLIPPSTLIIVIVGLILISCQSIVPAIPQPLSMENASADLDPCLETQGRLKLIKITSQHLGSQVDTNLYLPPGYEIRSEQRYPVLYLLHGAGFTMDDTHIDMWPTIGLVDIADRLMASGEITPFIIVMPPSLNFKENVFDPLLLNDIIPYIDNHYQTIPDRQHRAVGGVSLGGLLVLRVGLQNPDLFGSLAVHSLADGQQHKNIQAWLDQVSSEQMPAFYLDIGQDDALLISSHKHFKRALLARGIPHQVIENEGDHNYGYWREHLPEYLHWYSDQFTRPPTSYHPHLVNVPPTCLDPGMNWETSYLTGKNSVLLGQLNVYLPPCYEEYPEVSYPVLYLLHGGGMDEFSWRDMGAIDQAKQLMTSREVKPFILVTLPSVDYGPEFEELLLVEVVPHIDQKYRTKANRQGRAIGGISAGAVLAAQIAFQHPHLFGSVGLHSTAEPYGKRENFAAWLSDIPPQFIPNLYLDMGRDDDRLGSHQFFFQLLNKHRVPHINIIRTGWNNTPEYWEKNMEEYIRWYALMLSG